MYLPPELQQHIEKTLDSLTLEEQISLLSGKDFWRTFEIPGKVPSIKCTDGPSGARGQFFSGGTKAAFFPSAISLAATFNTKLLHSIGHALGAEAQTKKAQVLLGPTACNHRSPLGGRNFESYSEDPYLSGKMASAVIAGIQDMGVAATMKHFVANEQETKRFSVDEKIDERALREIYLKPFEIAVREADPWALMSSYNKINGEHADSHSITLHKVLRNEWNYDGLVVSDWGGTNSTIESIKAGLDLEMPGPTRHRGKTLLEATKTHNDPELIHAIRTGARHVLELIAKTGRWGRFREDPEEAVDRPEHRELIRKAGAEGIVLLKNTTGILPLNAKKIKKVAWIGPNANEIVAGGGGSANLNPHYLTNPLTSFREAVAEAGIEVGYENGCRTEKWVRLFPIDAGRARTEANGKGESGMVAEFFAGRECKGKPVERKIVKSSTLFLLDGKPEVLGDGDYSVRFSTWIRPEETGEHVFGLGSIGPTKVWVDGVEFIDHTEWTETGELFFSAGSPEVTEKLTLSAGTWSLITAETTCKSARQQLPDLGNDNLDFSSTIGIRMGLDRVQIVSSTISRAAKLAEASDVAVIIAGMNNEWESEGYDRHSMDLPGHQTKLIRAVASANQNTVVVIQSGCAVSMPWIDEVGAVVMAWYQGQEAGRALADVLIGNEDPGGRLPITLPKRLEDNPSYGNFGDDGGVENGNTVDYVEGVYVGYRHYTTREIPVLFPFGFGLSYTQFSHSPLTLSGNRISPSNSVVARTRVKNVGRRRGKEVLQLYVHQRTGENIDRPVRELKGFACVELAPGEERGVEIEVQGRDLGFWDEGVGMWRVVRGVYDVCIGRSVLDLGGKVAVKVEKGWEWVF
ncbi:hypothetical protein RUND412_004259 [Rhizina undulata]